MSLATAPELKVGPTILYVEDNLADVVLLKRAFASHSPGVRIASVGSGDEALRQLDSEPLPDLVILDINLPGLTGLQVLQSIRQMPRCEGLPVLVMTTSRSKEDVLGASDLGATGFMNKGSNHSELKQLVRNIAERWLAVESI